MPYQSIEKTEIEGVFKIQPKVFGDERGWYCPDLEMVEFKAATGVSLRVTQKASSFNSQKGILRGLHYQKPETQGKLVEVVSGSVLDVAVDIRKGSSTFGKVVSEVLTAKDHNQLWVPTGCAHGYLSLEENTCFTYIVTDGIYTPANEKGVNPFDPDLIIDWLIPRDQMILKDRDLSFKNLKDIPDVELL
jgi:dTDP-4-dehydrorhamnose 3,5-epimerase